MRAYSLFLLAGIIVWAPISSTAQQTAAQQIRGKIIGVGGGPVQGEIMLVQRGRSVRVATYRTDTQGSFSFSATPGPGTLLIARAEGYVSSEKEWSPALSRGPVQFVLFPSGSVSGRVVDESGAGIAGATVRVSYPGEPRSFWFGQEVGEAISDASGNFTVPLVARGRRFVLQAESPDRLPSSAVPLTAGTAELGGITLILARKGQAVRGKVLDMAGLPVAGASVRLRLLGGSPELTAEDRQSVAFGHYVNKLTRTGQDGSYEFTAVPSGRVLVVAGRTGTRPVRLEGLVTPGRDLHLNLLLP
jgi:hypothetical protein